MYSASIDIDEHTFICYDTDINTEQMFTYKDEDIAVCKASGRDKEVI